MPSKKIIIEYRDVSPETAMERVSRIVRDGYCSETNNLPHYCWHTSFLDGVEVSVRTKRRSNSPDSFVVSQAPTRPAQPV